VCPATGQGARPAPDPVPGNRGFEIKQPRMPKLVWQVTQVEPGRSWTWCQRSPGGTALASHEVVPLDEDRTLVLQRIDQRGPVGVAVGLLMKRLTTRYLDLEARGLRERSEERARLGAEAS
jgi:hypothetical protein